MSQPPIATLGPLDLLRPLGHGGMGEVWLAREREQGVWVAVKLLHPHLATRPGMVEDLYREVRATTSLQHPHIIEVFDTGVTPDLPQPPDSPLQPHTPFVLMEWLDGGSLALAPHPSDFDALRRRLLQLLDALAHAHARGLIHRDLKPANALLDTTGEEPRLVLSDFGIAHAIDPTTPERAEQRPRGTALYMAPEQINGTVRDQGAWTDLYALGVVAWEWVTGAPPFVAPSVVEILLRHLQAPFPTLLPRFPIPDELRDWLRAALARDPAHRLRCAADAARWLRAMRAPALPRGAVLPPLPLPEPGGDTLQDLLRSNTSPDLQPPTLEPQLPPPADLCDFPDEPAPPSPPPLTPSDLPDSWRETHRRDRCARPVNLGLHLVALRQPQLVGREDERDRIWDALRRTTLDDQPRALILRGAAGLGKSTLLRWAAERADELGIASTLYAYHHPTPGPLDGLPGMLAHLLRCAHLTPEEAALQARRTARTLGVPPLQAEHVNTLLDLLKPTLRNPEVEPPLPGDRRFRTFYGQDRLVSPRERLGLLLHLLRALTARRPILLCLDDVQFAPEALLLAISIMERARTEPLPIVILAAARPDDLAQHPFEARLLEQLAAQPGVSTSPLSPLPDDALRALLAELLVLDPTLAEQIIRRADGNPLFATAFIRDCAQRGVFAPGPQGFHLRDDACLLLPDNVRTLIQHNLQQLLLQRPANDRLRDLRVLLLAAVAGGPVSDDQWQRAARAARLHPDPTLVDLLEGAHLARRLEHGWTFTSPVVREALEALAERDGHAVDLNAAWAEALEALPHPNDPRVAWRIGQHHLRANQPDRALHHLDQATNLLHRAEGFEAAEQLIALRGRLFDQLRLTEDDPRRLDLTLDDARLRLERGFAQDAALRLSRVIALPHLTLHPEVHADALDLLGWTLLHQGRPDEALQHLQHALRLAEQHHPDAIPWRTRSLANALLRAGRPRDAIPLLHSAVRDLRRLNRRQEATHALVSIGEAWLALQQPDRAEQLLQDALALCRSTNDRLETGRALNALGRARLLLHDPEGALDLHRQALLLLDEAHSNLAADARARAGVALLTLARPHDAFPLLEEALREAADSGMIDLRARTLAALLAATAALNDFMAFDLMAAELAADLHHAPPDPDRDALLQSALLHARHADQTSRAQRLLTFLRPP